MGNKLGKKRQVVDEKYTRPQGLYQNRQLDYKWLRKHILDSKLAPCYPGEDEFDDREQCPICLLYYPCLNRSKCCAKGICTECFMQMKSLVSTRFTQCPFCKTSNYEVEYRGVRTKEEKGQDQIEEQKVIEAKIRIRQQEIQDENKRMLLREERVSSNENDSLVEDVQFEDVSNNFFSATPNISSIQSGDFIPHEEHASVDIIRPTTFSQQTGEDDYDMDLEELMVLEAIWLSSKKNNLSQNMSALGVTASELSSSGDRYSSLSSTTDGCSPSGGIAYAIAALAERQQMGLNSNVSISDSMPALEFQPSSSHVKTYQGKKSGWGMNYDGHDSIDVGPSRAIMDPVPESTSTSLYPVEMEESLLSSMPVPIVPESFEEQMKLAIAASLAESYPRHHRHGLV